MRKGMESRRYSSYNKREFNFSSECLKNFNFTKSNYKSYVYISLDNAKKNNTPF